MMSEALINRLVEFAESGNQQKICLNEKCYQGSVSYTHLTLPTKLL